MALMVMNDYTGEMEDLKVIQAYGGIPRQYPLGINGFGMSQSDCEDMLNNPLKSSRDYEAAGCSDNSYTEKGMAAPNNQFQPTTPFGKNVQDFFNVLTPQIQQIAPLFKKNPKQKVFVQKEQDYTTYAVIGGAVIVAAVLAIAVGKSGRRKD